MGSWCSSDKTTDTNRGRRGLRRPGDKPRKDDNDVDEPYKDLKVEDIDLLIDENSKDHHTDTYVLTDSKAKLVIRRGHPFRVRIRFSRKVNWREDNLRIDFSAGSFPQHGDGTLVQIPLSENESFDPRGKWKAEKLGEKDSELEVKIHTPSDCIVYKWLFRIEILEKKDGKNIVHVNKKIFPINMYIIFNPWNKADTVYLEDKDLRQEYVLNDEGAIWVGDPTDYRTWSFGQFEKNVLDCTMYQLDLIDLSSFSMKARASPVLVSRRLSAVGNGFDNDGLLEGNWSGEYQGGTSPTKWRGSVKIMQQFWKTKAAVKYGQCWVFSGVLTTMCRAIGIPCRSITNYSSAHDTDGSITIDRVFNIEGVKESNDSTWNFHVWNEVWMKRPDIPKGKYDGWQAIDCTPQERSSGLFQCGPMPVAAMKEGDLSYNYDGAFIFAEVNADIVTWVNGRDGQPYLSDIERQRVGRDISTRKPGDSKVNVREDITDAYKYKEGTAEEKESVLTALKVASTHSEENYKAYKGYINTKEKNVEAKLDIQSQTKYGDDFVVYLTAINKSEKEQSVYGTVSCKPENYAAEGLDRIKFSDVEGTIPPKGKDGKISLEVTVTTNDYMGKLHDGCYISVVGVLFNYTTQQASLIEKSFRLKKPELKVETTEKDLKLNQPFYVKMSFTNPLNQTLKKCEIDIEGVGIIGPAEGSLPQGDVGPGKEFTTQIQVTATRPGFSRIGAVFTCAELYDVAGNCWVLAL